MQLLIFVLIQLIKLKSFICLRKPLIIELSVCKKLSIDYIHFVSDIGVGRNLKVLLIKITKSLGSRAVKKTPSFIIKSFGGSNKVVVRAQFDGMQLSLSFQTLRLALISKVYYITASSNMRGLKNLNSPL